VGCAGLDPTANLFGEGASSVLLSAPPDAVAMIERTVAGSGLECRRIGQVLSDPVLRIDADIESDIAELRAIYEQALPRRVHGHG
jgi:selenophosphate synthetase-related protein